MLLVIFGHMIEPLIGKHTLLNDIYNLIYLFHIPAFVFISGYLSGRVLNVNFDSLIKSLVIPLVLFSVIYELPELIINNGISGYLRVLTPNWILWFLVSLLFWRLLTPLVIKFRFALIISVLLSILASLTNVDGYTYGVFRTIVLFPFYILGVMLSSRREFIQKINIKYSWSIISLIALSLIPLIDLPFNRYFLYCVAPFSASGYDNESGALYRMAYYPISFFAIVLFSISMSNMRFLANIGRNSLHVYLWHGLIVKYYLWSEITKLSPSTLGAISISIFISLSLGYFLSSKYVAGLTNKITNIVLKILIKREFNSL